MRPLTCARAERITLRKLRCLLRQLCLVLHKRKKRGREEEGTGRKGGREGANLVFSVQRHDASFVGAHDCLAGLYYGGRGFRLGFVSVKFKEERK